MKLIIFTILSVYINSYVHTFPQSSGSWLAAAGTYFKKDKTSLRKIFKPKKN